MGERVELSEGDIFERVERGDAAAVMKDVLHDWHDERCTQDPQDRARRDADRIEASCFVETLQEPNHRRAGRLVSSTL